MEPRQLATHRMCSGLNWVRNGWYRVPESLSGQNQTNILDPAVDRDRSRRWCTTSWRGSRHGRRIRWWPCLDRAYHPGDGSQVGESTSGYRLQEVFIRDGQCLNLYIYDLICRGVEINVVEQNRLLVEQHRLIKNINIHQCPRFKNY